MRKAKVLQYVPRNMHMVLLCSRLGLAWLAAKLVAMYWFKCSGFPCHAADLRTISYGVGHQSKALNWTSHHKVNCDVLLIRDISVTIIFLLPPGWSVRNVFPLLPRLISLGYWYVYNSIKTLDTWPLTAKQIAQGVMPSIVVVAAVALIIHIDDPGNNAICLFPPSPRWFQMDFT